MTICYSLIYVAEAVITWLYFDRLYEKKRRPIFIFFGFAAVYVALLFAFSTTHPVVNAVAFFLCNFALEFFLYRCTGRTAILQATILTFALLATELCASLLLSGLFGSFSAYQTDLSMLVAMAVVSKLLYFALTTLLSRLFAPSAATANEPHRVLIFCSVPLLSLAVTLVSVQIGFHYGLSHSAQLLLVISMLTLLAVNLLMVLLYRYLLQINEENTKLHLALQKERTDLAYYTAMQKQMDAQNILIHDFKHHVHAIRTLAAEGRGAEIDDYAARLDREFLRGASVRRSDDITLNVILSRTAQACDERGIALHCDIRDGCVGFLDAPSKTSLFDNLLSNAVTAAAASEEKEIDLSICKQLDGAAVVISVVNSCDLAPESDGKGFYRSRKGNSELHGIGMKSIERVVRKYHGNSTTHYDPNAHRFHYVIRFPENEK